MTSLATAPVSRVAVANYLERDILSGRYKPGERLPSERQLADTLQVSRPIVREALRSLAERNLVEVRPGRGTYVRDPDSSEFGHHFDSAYKLRRATPRDLVEARQMIECTCAELAAERATEIDIRVMETAVERCIKSTSIVDKMRYDLSFHLALARAAHNPVIETMFTSITGLTLELMFRSLSDSGVSTASLPYHTKIVEAVRHRDPAAAAQAMSNHLEVASRMYGDDYEETVDGVAKRELDRLFAPGVTLEELLAVPER